jgi:predicted enzyme related to lactoylglutathione lyase
VELVYVYDQSEIKNKKTSLKLNMKNKFNPVVYFEIPVTDIERAIQFYSAVFNFDFERDIIHDNEMAFFPLTEGNSGISGALAKGEIYKPTINGTLIYFNTEDIEKTLNLALKNGAEVLFPITSNGEYGSVAEFKDCEGNRIALHMTNK